MKSDKQIIQTNKEDLHELLVSLTSSDRENQSKFWGEVKKTLDSHGEQLNELTKSINSLNVWQARMEGGRKTLIWSVSTFAGIIMILIGLIYSQQNEKIASIESKVTNHAQAQAK